LTFNAAHDGIYQKTEIPMFTHVNAFFQTQHLQKRKLKAWNSQIAWREFWDFSSKVSFIVVFPRRLTLYPTSLQNKPLCTKPCLHDAVSNVMYRFGDANACNRMKWQDNAPTPSFSPKPPRCQPLCDAMLIWNHRRLYATVPGFACHKFRVCVCVCRLSNHHVTHAARGSSCHVYCCCRQELLATYFCPAGCRCRNSRLENETGLSPFN
jgi:hypothetical protein